MFTRITSKKYKNKVYRSLHVLESYRDEDGRNRQRLVANLGDPKQYTAKDIGSVIQGLKKLFEIDDEPKESGGTTVTMSLGGAHAIFHLWERLGWTRVIRRQLARDRFKFDVIANIKTLITHRLLDPGSKLSILDWIESVYLPGVPMKEITYNHLLRAMDFLEKHKEDLEVDLASSWTDLFAQDVDILFYDLTSSYFQIDEADPEEAVSDRGEISTLRQYGYSRDHRPDLPQVVIGLVMTKSGIPLAHHVFPGNTMDKTTVKKISEDLKKRFRIKNCVFIGDRGLMTKDNRVALEGEGYGFILAHPMRSGNDVKRVMDLVEDSLKQKIAAEKERAERAGEPMTDVVVEAKLDGRRFVVSHNEEIAAQTKKSRVGKLIKTDAFCRKLAEKLDSQDDGESFPGKKLTDQGALIKIHDKLRDGGLLSFTTVYLNKEGRIAWEPKEEARRWENRIDGKLFLETSNSALLPEEVVARYKDLQEIERCFRTVKSSLDLRPMFHRVDRRIRAHAFLCVMALQIDRWMRIKLRESSITTMPERVLDKLSRIVALETGEGDDRKKAVTTPTSEQLTFFKALEVPRPTHNDFTFESGL